MFTWKANFEAQYHSRRGKDWIIMGEDTNYAQDR